MKLPEITYNIRVQNLAKKSPFLPVARAGTRVAGARMVGAAAAATGAIARDIYDRQIKMEVEKFQEDWALTESQIDDELDEQKEFNQVDDYGRARTVPGWVGRPDAKREAKQQALDELLPSISDTEMAGTVRAATMERINKGYGRDLLIANAEQKEARMVQQGDAIQTFMQKGNYDAAREIAANFEDPSKRQALKFGIDKQEETDPIYQAMTANDVPEMERHLKIIQNPEYEGTLLNKEREMLAGQLEAEIWKAGKTQRDAVANQARMLKDQASKMVSTMEAGAEYSARQVDEMILQLKGISGTEVLQNDLLVAQSLSKEINQLKYASPTQRFAYTEQVRKNLTGDIDSMYNYQKLTAAVERMDNEQRKDPMEFAYQTGMIEPPQIDPQNLVPAFEQMRRNADMVEANSGIATGPLTRAQAAEFATRLSKMPVEQVLNTFGQMEQGFGEDVFKAYEQLEDAGLSATLPVAGKVFSQGERGMAWMIAEGARLRQENPKGFKDINTEMDRRINKQIGVNYSNKKNRRSNMVEAIKNMTMYKLQQIGNPNPTVFNSDVKDIVNESIEQVTGGMITYNGKQIVPPVRGYGQDRFDTYINNLNPAQVKAMNNSGPAGMSTKEFIEMIQNEEADLMPQSEGIYHVWSNRRNGYITTRQGSFFRFRFIDNITREQ